MHEVLFQELSRLEQTSQGETRAFNVVVSCVAVQPLKASIRGFKVLSVPICIWRLF